ncbi:MAG: hypothetical protein ABIG71_00950 [Candidatus Uhrbacteria bacterium]
MAELTDDREHIVITSENRATYEHVRICAEQSRVMDQRTVSAAVLLGRRNTILPSHCVAHTRRDNMDIYVIEQRPRVRTVCLEPGAWRRPHSQSQRAYARLIEQRVHEQFNLTENQLYCLLCSDIRQSETFTVAFPFVILIARFSKGVLHRCSMFYRNHPLASAEDRLYYADLPNVTKHGTVCLSMGMHFKCGTRDTQSPFDQIAHIEELLWSSSWGGSMWAPYFEYGHPDAVCTPWDWVLSTRKNPEFILSVPWTETKWTLGSMLSLLRDNEDERTNTDNGWDWERHIEREVKRKVPTAFEELKRRVQCT